MPERLTLMPSREAPLETKFWLSIFTVCNSITLHFRLQSYKLILIIPNNCASFYAFLCALSNALMYFSFEKVCEIKIFSLSLQRQNIIVMSYTREPIVIENPSEKLLKTIKKLREHKLSELEKLRNMKPEEFSCRILL